MSERRRITVVFEEAGDMEGWWVVHSPDLPGVNTQGNGFVDAIEMFKDAYEMMREDEDERPTDGLTEGRREERDGLDNPRGSRQGA